MVCVIKTQESVQRASRAIMVQGVKEIVLFNATTVGVPKTQEIV